MSNPYSQTIELLHAARNGDREALAHIVAKYHDRLLSRIRLMMGPQARRCAESGDFLQTAFLDLCTRGPIEQIDNEERLFSYIMAIARNNISSAVRKKREHALTSFSSTLIVPVDGRTPSTDARHAESIEHLVMAIEGLKDDYRQVIELRSLEQLPFQEVAKRMGKSEAAVHMLHARALLKLGARLRSDRPQSA